MNEAERAYSELEQVLEDTGAPPCSNYPDAYFSAEETKAYPIKIDDLKALCMGCPAVVACAKYAIVADEEWGIWGGLTPNDRRAIKRRLPLADHAPAAPRA